MDPNKYGRFHKGPSKILMFLPSPQRLTFLSAHVFHESWFSSWFVSMQPSCLLYSHSFLTLLHLNNLVSYWRKALQYYLHFFRDTGTSPTEGLIPLLVSTCCFHDALAYWSAHLMTWECHLTLTLFTTWGKHFTPPELHIFTYHIHIAFKWNYSAES